MGVLIKKAVSIKFLAYVFFLLSLIYPLLDCTINSAMAKSPSIVPVNEASESNGQAIDKSVQERYLKKEKVSHISSDESVRLIEHIFERLRNLPQLAISKNKQAIAFQAKTAFPNEYLSDRALLIKPKDFPNSPSREPLLVAAKDVMSDHEEVAQQSMPLRTAIIWERNANQKGVLTLNKNLSSAAPAMESSVIKVTPSQSQTLDLPASKIISKTPLITEFANTKSAEQNYPGYSISIQDEKANAQSVTDQLRRMEKAILSSHSQALSKLGKALSAPARVAEQIDYSTVVAQAKKSYRGLNSLRGAGVVPKPALTGSLNRDMEIAFLPPTIIGGMIGVRLGTSERDLDKTIFSFGSVQKELVRGWRVWSVREPKTANTRLQVFSRHGLVEAIRVFDPLLLRSEFGVTIGDELSRVKQKFGEPAFILTESAATVTQNYIYPMSQIGFQIAQKKPGTTPLIMSIVVFNVKY